MDAARLQELFAAALAKGDGVEVVEAGRTIRIDVSGTFSTAAHRTSDVAAPCDAPEAGTIGAPCFGIVHLTPAPGAPPFVAVGDAVAPGQRLCLVEAMKVFNPVAADIAGRVAEVLVASGAEVERGQKLFRLAPADGDA